jgi:hypothetical protein
MKRRPRISECRTVQDFVRAGVLRAVQPSTSGGYTAYGTGRDFSTTAALTFVGSPGNPLGIAAGTVAARVIPAWAGNDNTGHNIAFCNASVSGYIALTKTTGNAWMCRISDGVAQLASSTSAALAFSANTTHHIVARYAGGAAMSADLNSDGTDAAQGTSANPGPSAATTTLTIGGTTIFTGYIGPVLLSGSRKSDGWVTAIQANSGAAYSSITRLVRDYMAVGDVIVPLIDNSTAYIRVA